MKSDDPRLAAFDLNRRSASIRMRVPRPGDVTAIIARPSAPASAPLSPTIRAIVLRPSRYLDQRVTITGPVLGRNLTGDLPDAPARSRYDFVLRSADAGDLGGEHPAEGEGLRLRARLAPEAAAGCRYRAPSGRRTGLLWIDADAAA